MALPAVQPKRPTPRAVAASLIFKLEIVCPPPLKVPVKATEGSGMSGSSAVPANLPIGSQLSYLDISISAARMKCALR